MAEAQRLVSSGERGRSGDDPRPHERQLGTLRAHHRLDALAARKAAIGGLRVGSRGRAVLNLQRHLRAVGSDAVPIDGVYGATTAAAVRAFQRAEGLLMTGRVNRQTWDRLRARLFAAMAALVAASRPTPTPSLSVHSG